METVRRLSKTTLAASLALVFGLASTQALALSLGRLTVQSALGEPLRAEVDIPDLSSEEASSVTSAVASPETFAAAGLEYNSALTGVKVTLERRSDGRAYLSLRSDKVINDPFVDIIMQAKWASGSLSRDYTMLFDPPNLRPGTTTAPTAPQLSGTPTTQAAVPSPSTPQAPATPAEPKTPSNPSAGKATPAVPAPAVAGRPIVAKEGMQVTVRPGDTASKIADAHKTAEVSLEQMLVAMLRDNPDAFLGKNINRLKSGAVLNVPGSEQAAEIPKAEAVKTVLAQARDFNQFRQQVAGAAPAVASNDRQSQGKVQTQVNVKKPAESPADRLTLSKPNGANKALEDKIAADRQAKENAARTAELERNLAELNRLKAASATKTPTPVAPAPSLTASATMADATKAAPSPTVAVSQSSVGLPVAVAPLPVASTTAPRPVPVAKPASVIKPAPKPVEEPSLLDSVLDDPLIPVGGGVGVLVLGGAAWWLSRRRKPAAAADSSFLDSHLQPDSFFGASGGEQVDTSNEEAPTGTSMIYSPSQLDTAGDVDPVAEADVYLAYGRDQQAEEILKDALQVNPSRLAIHAKLADIYHKRGDASAFAALATSAHDVSQGNGPEWEHIRNLGLELDRNNPLFQDERAASVPQARSQPAAPAPKPTPTPTPTPVTKAASPMAAPPVAPPAKVANPSPVDLDFDLDFDLAHNQQADDDYHPSAIAVLHDDGTASAPIALYNAPSAKEEAPKSLDHMLELPPEIGPSTPPKVKSHTAVNPAPAPSFDMSSVSLDLDMPAAKVGVDPTETDNMDPLSTKLALAREFQSIGDTDGAHALAEEVFTQATGNLRNEAKKFLTELGFAQSGFEASKF